MSNLVLFLCPHNAAKSVLALAYFRDLAARHGLPHVADSAGTDPDAEVWPSVVELLRADGIAVPSERPRHVTDADLQRAFRIISLGCELSGGEANVTVEHWNDVPAASADLVASRDAIRAHVEALVHELRDSVVA